MAQGCKTRGLELHGSYLKIFMDITFPNHTEISSSEKASLVCVVWSGITPHRMGYGIV